MTSRFLGSVFLLTLGALALGQVNCATTDVVPGPPSGTDDGGPASDAPPPPDTACGAADGPCCAQGLACKAGLECVVVGTSAQCKPTHAKDIGKPCTQNTDCTTGLCTQVQFPTGATGDDGGGSEFPDGGGPPSAFVCTEACATGSECEPGWACTEFTAGHGICTCTATPVQCDGQDHNCTGILDQEPYADQYCTQQAGVPEVCQNHACACVDSCNGNCVDLENDPANCGTCNTNCDPNLQLCQKGTCVCGNAAGTVQSCGGKCVDTATDNANCGACGATCGFACAAGACGPVEMPTTSAGAFVLDDKNIYWSDNSSSIFACPLAGCTTATTVTSNAFSVSEMVLSSGTLYWMDVFGDISSCPTSGCVSPTSVTTSTSGGFAAPALAQDATNLYWAAQVDNFNADAGTFTQTAQILKCAKTGCTTPTVLFTDSSTFANISFLAVDGTNVIFSDGSTGLEICPTTGTCTSPTLVGSFASTFAASGGTVVYTSGSAVDSCGEGASCPTPTTISSTETSVTSVGIGGTTAYWVDSVPTTGAVKKCAITGCTTPTTILGNRNSPLSIQVGPNRVAWEEQGTTGNQLFVYSN